MATLTERLKKLRVNKKLSIHQLSNAVGLSQSEYKQY